MNNPLNKADAPARVNAKSNYRPPVRQLPVGDEAKRGFPPAKRKWDDRSSDEAKAAAKARASAVRAFWREYFEQFPDYEGNSQLNRMREHFADIRGFRAP